MSNENQHELFNPDGTLKPVKVLQKEDKESLLEQPKKTQETAENTPIPVNSKGVLQPRNMADLIYLAKLYHQAAVFSESFNTPQKLLIGLQMSVEMGISPMKFLNSAYIVKNRVKLHSGMPKALVHESGRCTSYREYLIDMEYKEICIANKNLNATPYAAVCETKRDGNSEPQVTYFTVDDAKRAGLTEKGVWKSYLGRMLLSKARMHNLEYHFGDVLCGLSDHDEDESSRGHSTAKEINAEFKELAKKVGE